MFTRLIIHFLKLESSGGVILFCAAVLAIIFRNSPLQSGYEHLLHLPFSVQLGGLGLSKPLHHWINDGLMAIFFLLVGLELKREFVDGELRSLRQILLPLVAAIGGMVFPALCYLFLIGDVAELHRGWAIPTATDIAFALGVLSLFGSRVPTSLRIFLTTLAIFDDLGAIIVIALFYSAGLSWVALGLAVAVVGVLVAINRWGVIALTPYCLAGLVLWVCVLESGVHATLAGVVLALTIPHRRSLKERSPLLRLEHTLHPWVAFAVLPIFGFANAGVSLTGVSLSTLAEPLVMGIACGLFFGKQVGIFLSVWCLVKLGYAKLPKHSSWTSFYGVCVIAGIGFTMSLFIGTLAFHDLQHQTQVQVGVIMGSLTSGILGYALVALGTRRR